ncbi:SDR family oxidoreductase [Sphingomonas montana]|uniref:SDR family oxidoreductase n=1 Tax=Sphingomonas montana TaxID=1843236 RepID=UPI00096E6542|nr:NAD(P)H-binding protein [Sphingomonas montana]
MTIIAMTGGTGFVGGHLLTQAVAAGHRVRALARRPQPARDGVEWIAGSLDEPHSLAALMEGAQGVIHVAGAVNAADRAGFARVNIDGTAAVLAAATGAGITRFVHVSSLSAREPQLSDYGWSKAQAEGVVTASGLDWSIVRPPAIYGPGDREMLEIFRMAARGVVLLPPAGRFSIIAAEDLARLLLVQLTAYDGCILEADDGTPDGWDYHAFARLLGTILGRRRVRTVAMPGMLLALGARIDGLVRGKGAKLTPDRVGYLRHPDWVVRDPMPDGPWRPLIATPAGLHDTARWYRAHGWL